MWLWLVAIWLAFLAAHSRAVRAVLGLATLGILLWLFHAVMGRPP